MSSHLASFPSCAEFLADVARNVFHLKVGCRSGIFLEQDLLEGLVAHLSGLNFVVIAASALLGHDALHVICEFLLQSFFKVPVTEVTLAARRCLFADISGPRHENLLLGPAHEVVHVLSLHLDSLDLAHHGVADVVVFIRNHN